MVKNIRFNSLRILLFFATALLLVNCNSAKKKPSSDAKVQDFVTQDDIFDDIDKAKKIFYSLPSPLETAMLIKSAGAKYDEELLNSMNNRSKYTTNKSMALNLGVYTTDLSFASLFDQTQTSINYMNAARSMAEGLDIQDAIDDETLKRLEDNLSNRDVVMDIISETFLNCSSYLKENERQDVAAIVLVGGWVEGLYLASKLVGNASIENNKLADRMIEQKLSFNIVQRMLDDNKQNEKGVQNADIVQLMDQLKDLKIAFDKVKVVSAETTTEKNDSSNITTLKSKTKVSVSAADFKQLQSEVDKLRTSFIH
jgi:hypothetical protein